MILKNYSALIICCIVFNTFTMEQGSDSILSQLENPTKSLLRLAKLGELDVTCADELLKLGAEINQLDNLSKTALSYIAERGTKELFEFLLTRGASTEECYRLGDCCLNSAAQYGNIGVMEALIARGVDVNRKNTCGETPLIVSAMKGQVEATRLLLAHGAKKTIDVPAWPDRETPLTMAAGLGDAEIVALLLEHGADPSLANRYGVTPLMKAASYDHWAIILMLLNHNQDIDQTSHDGYTALMFATNANRPKTVYNLLALGANATIQNKWGETALDCANERKNSIIVTLLSISPYLRDATFRHYEFPYELSLHIGKFVKHNKKSK